MREFILSAFADEASPAFEGQIAALKRNGIGHIEIRNLDGKGVLEHEAAALKAYASRLRAEGIGVSAIGSPIGKIGVTDPFAPHVEAFKRAMEAAHLFGTKRIRMFSFFMPQGEDPAVYRDAVLERLDALLELAEKEEIVCCHENEKEIYGDTAARTLDLHRALGGRLHAVLDPANYVQCGEKPAEVYPRLAPYLRYLHIKDALREDGAIVPAGQGDGQIPELLSLYAQKEGDLFVTLEPHLTTFAGLQGLQNEQLLNKFTFASQDEAFDAAVAALKNIIQQGGYQYV